MVSKRTTRIIIGALIAVCGITTTSTIWLTTAEAHYESDAYIRIIHSSAPNDTVWDTFDSCLSHYIQVEDKYGKNFMDYCVVYNNYQICENKAYTELTQQNDSFNNTERQLYEAKMNKCNAQLQTELAILAQVEPIIIPQIAQP